MTLLTLLLGNEKETDYAEPDLAGTRIAKAAKEINAEPI